MLLYLGHVQLIVCSASPSEVRPNDFQKFVTNFSYKKCLLLSIIFWFRTQLSGERNARRLLRCSLCFLLAKTGLLESSLSSLVVWGSQKQGWGGGKALWYPLMENNTNYAKSINWLWSNFSTMSCKFIVLSQWRKRITGNLNIAPGIHQSCSGGARGHSRARGPCYNPQKGRLG